MKTKTQKWRASAARFTIKWKLLLVAALCWLTRVVSGNSLFTPAVFSKLEYLGSESDQDTKTKLTSGNFSRSTPTCVAEGPGEPGTELDERWKVELNDYKAAEEILVLLPYSATPRDFVVSVGEYPDNVLCTNDDGVALLSEIHSVRLTCKGQGNRFYIE